VHDPTTSTPRPAAAPQDAPPAAAAEPAAPPTPAAQAVLARAAALESEGRAAEALLLLEDAATRDPSAGVLAALADHLHARGRLARATASYERALALDPALVPAWWGLGCAQAAQLDHPAAVHAFRQLLALDARHGPAWTNLGRSLFALGDVDAAMDSFRAALPHLGEEERSVPLLNMATSIAGSPAATFADVLAARRAWVASIRTEPQAEPAPPRRSPGVTGRPVRLGYVSAFFGSPNWMKPVWPLLAHHDRERFAVHVLSDGRNVAATGYPADPRDAFHDVSALTNEALADLVRGLEIDVLVDLNGYSRAPRLPLFLLRPAPVQVAWFNHFGPPGLDGAFDCLVGDGHVVPDAEASWYGEQVVRVEGTYLPFDVTYPVPDVAPAPCATGAPLTFGCLAPLYKVTPAVLAAWSRILAGSPGARLLLKNELLGQPSVRAHVRARFTAAGVDGERLALDGPAEHTEFLRGYDRIDVALDTFPYNGGTTTSEALWQGVPVLTFPGDRWAARISTSLLRAAGLEEWVAANADDYVARAIRLAADPETPARLTELRQTLRARLEASGACDVAGLTQQLERVYLELAARR
jgi:predicted O-linked N-acetylglucosamine transferase (SPINDLY family)